MVEKNSRFGETHEGNRGTPGFLGSQLENLCCSLLSGPRRLTPSLLPCPQQAATPTR